MAKRSADDMTTKEGFLEGDKEKDAHPYAFHVSGPRNVPSPNWRDLINSNWSVPSILYIFSVVLILPMKLDEYVLCVRVW